MPPEKIEDLEATANSPDRTGLEAGHGRETGYTEGTRHWKKLEKCSVALSRLDTGAESTREQRKYEKSACCAKSQVATFSARQQSYL